MSDPILVVGVVADTHIPDRKPALNSAVLPALQSAGVGLILHAGDICSRNVLEDLAQVAPVTAVQGNRDFVALSGLPKVQVLTLGGARVVLAHGHGGWINYLVDKLRYLMSGYQVGRYQNGMTRLDPDGLVYVFGHTHKAENFWYGGRLFFNPGSASFGSFPGTPPSIGVLRFFGEGKVEGAIVPLDGSKKFRKE